MARPVFGETAPVRKGSVFRDTYVERDVTTIAARPPRAKKPSGTKPCCKNCEGLGALCYICKRRMHDGQNAGRCGICDHLILKGRDPLDGRKPYDGRYDGLDPWGKELVAIDPKTSPGPSGGPTRDICVRSDTEKAA